MCRVKSFIMEGIEPYHSELRNLLFPLFAHIFLELLLAGQKVQGINYVLAAYENEVDSVLEHLHL